MRLVITLGDTWNKTFSMNMLFKYSQNHFPYGQSTFFKFKKLIYHNCCLIIFRHFCQTSNFIVYAYAKAISCSMLSTFDTVYLMVIYVVLQDF